MKIGIVGRGVVGNALAYGLKRGHEIVSYDKFKEGYQNLRDVVKTEIIFFCLPTPMNINGEIDLTPLEALIDKVVTLSKKDRKTLVIKSTAVSGTTKTFADKYPNHDFAFCPEFLTDRNANEDFINTTRIIIGTNDVNVFDRLSNVFKQAHFTCPILFTDFTTAEFIKYFSNILLACKVTLANEMYAIAQKLGINYDIAKEILLMDRRFGQSHLEVPGNDGDKGFGGRCLPKDLNAFIHLAKQYGYNAEFLKAVWDNNLKWRNKKDW